MRIRLVRANALAMVAILLLGLVPQALAAEPPFAGPGVRAIASGSDFDCALLYDGRVYCWGKNAYGQLGNGTTTASAAPRQVAGVTTAVAIAAADTAMGGPLEHACAVLATGSVVCWGYNGQGQLGNGTTTSSSVPVAVAGITTAVSVAAAGGATCALLADHTVRCWGMGRKTPAAVGGVTSATTVSIGSDGSSGRSCALQTSPAGVVCWGLYYPYTAPKAVAGLATATSISVGFVHACARLSDGTIRCWGSNWAGQLGDGTEMNASDTPVRPVGVASAIAASAVGDDSSGSSCAVISDGTVKCWGPNFGLLPIVAAGVTGATAISAGDDHQCVIVGMTRVACWTSRGAVPVTVVGLGGGPTATVTPSATVTNAASVTYKVAFSESVTGLSATDFTKSGTATGCIVGAPIGSGAAYVVAVSGCSEGTLKLTLKANSVTDVLAASGPATAVSARTVTIDRTLPTITPVTISLRTGGQVTVAGALRVDLSWAGSDGAGTGIARYQVARSVDSGATWTVLTSYQPASPYTTSVASSGVVRFRVRAVDKAGNVGAWSTTADTTPLLRQEASFAFVGPWSTAASASYSGGAVKYSSTIGASATFTFTGRAVAFVTTEAASRGQVKIYVDGTLIAWPSTYAATTAYRMQLWSYGWATSAQHTVKLVVVGTVGHPRIDVDAMAILK